MPKSSPFFYSPLLILFLFFCFSARGEEGLGLADCLKLASENYGKLKGSDYAIEAAKWRANEADARFWPVLEYKNRMAPVPTDASNPVGAFFDGDVTFFNSLRVALALPIYASGQLTFAQKLAQQGIAAEEAKKDNEESKLHHDVRQFYYGVLFGQEMEFLLEDAVHKIKSWLTKEEETQALSPYKLAKLKIFKLELEKKVFEARTKRKVAEETLRIQVGLPQNQPFHIKKEPLQLVVTSMPSIEQFQKNAKTDRGDSHLLDIGVLAKRFEGSLERRKLLPQVGAGMFVDFGRTTGDIRNLGTTTAINNPFNYTQAGLGLEIRGNVDFHGGRARIKRLDSEYQKALVESSLGREGIALEVAQSYQEAKEALANVLRAEEKKKLARQMLFFSKSNQEIGVGDDQEYVDALQLVLLSRAEYYKSVFDLNVAYSKLQWKAGHTGL